MMTTALGGGRIVAHQIALVCGLLACCPCAFALNPALDVGQYAHTAWTIRDGFFKGRISAIAQTLDGYLWLGTEFGLVRFDGVRAVPWQPPARESLPNNYIRSLLTARDGTLWIGTLTGVASWKDGELTPYRALADLDVMALVEDREGTIWAGGELNSSGRLCAFRQGSFECHGADGSLGRWVTALRENGGKLWVAAETGLWQWAPGSTKLFALPEPASGALQVLAEGAEGEPLIVTSRGIRTFVDGGVGAFLQPVMPPQVAPSQLCRDRDGGLWIGTQGSGLLHVHQGRMDRFTRSDGLSSNTVNNLFEDREGNLWISTQDGLDRFREFGVVTFSAGQGLPNIVGAVLAARDGSVWFSSLDGGLNRWSDGQIARYREERDRLARDGEPSAGKPKVREILERGLPDRFVGSLFEDGRGRIWVGTRGSAGYLADHRFVPVARLPDDGVNAIAEDSRGSLWVLTTTLGLVRVIHDEVVERIPWSKLGRNDRVSRLAADPARGGLWLGFFRGDVVHYADGRIDESFAATDGLGKGHVNDLRVDRRGTLWAATDAGLSRVRNGRVATLTSQNGLPCDAVDWTLDDDADSIWLYAACGLVRIDRRELEAWGAAVDENHQDQRAIQATVFGASDGVRSASNLTSFSPHLVKASDGKLWFVTPDGIGVIDPRHLPFNPRPPPVHVEEIIADHKTYDAATVNGQIKLPALTRDLQIDYTALSLVAPEKMRFKYLLEGYDRDWNDVTRRQAYYQNLKPRAYRFHVIASNNSGVWNETGAYLDFSIDHAYYQTTWFLAAMVSTALLLIAGLYRFRVRQVAHQNNLRIEERVNERIRIARDLHDTLLQSFHAIVLQFRAITYLLPDRPQDAKQTLDHVIDDASKAIVDARNAVQGLRASTDPSTTVVDAIAALAKELEAEDSSPARPQFVLHVEGTPGILQPLVRDDVYRIAREALRNAFRHANAAQIEVDVRYDRRQFRLRIRDDGKGIDDTVAAAGARPGHYGLAGMRERTELLGGTFSLWSQPGLGTEIELTIPASVAYAKRSTSPMDPAR